MTRPQQRLRVTDVDLHTVIEQFPMGTAILGPDGRCLLVNAAWNALWDPRESGLKEGSNVFENKRLRAMGLIPYLRECMDNGEVHTSLLFCEAMQPGSGLHWLRAFIYPVRDETGALLEIGLVFEDVTERRALEEQLAHQAFHDPLTSLPNRALFLDRLGHALSRAKQRDERGEAGKVALLYMDLDDFKRFNDSLGHNAGDQLLVGVAKRVEACLRLGDTFARFGGDEFAMLLENCVDVGIATEVAERIKRELSAPFNVDGHEAVITTSIGIVMAALGATGEDYAEELMRRADIAMYQSKGGGKDRHEVFSSGMNHSLKRLRLEEDLRRALKHEEFRVHYQPQVLISTGETVSFEALVRWEHPERGLLLPSEFISLAEETGMIVPIGRWVLEEACRQTHIFREQISPMAPMKMFVNLSARQFLHLELVEAVAAILSETGMDPCDLALEITESVMMEKGPIATANLWKLKNLGVSLAMDDFGTGYSSISQLKSFPVDSIKIDRSMIEGVDKSPEDLAVASASIDLAHALDLEVVAEGVETAEEREKLHALGCNFGQGYYWRKPCPAKR
jgi:diguanylate cyclase (GGDEF)-like protein